MYSDTINLAGAGNMVKDTYIIIAANLADEELIRNPDAQPLDESTMGTGCFKTDLLPAGRLTFPTGSLKMVSKSCYIRDHYFLTHSLPELPWSATFVQIKDTERIETSVSNRTNDFHKGSFE